MPKLMMTGHYFILPLHTMAMLRSSKNSSTQEQTSMPKTSLAGTPLHYASKLNDGNAQVIKELIKCRSRHECQKQLMVKHHFI